MKIHQLNALVAIDDTGSIRAAARMLGLSPAALTRAIRELEVDLCVQLVIRSAAGIAFTAYGQSLVANARLVVGQIARARSEIDAMLGSPTGRLTVGVTPWVALAFLPETIQRFMARMPDVKLEIYEGLQAIVRPRLRDGTIDFAIGRLVPAAAQAEFEHAPLFVTHSTVVARHGHPNEHSRTLGELADATWVLPWDVSSSNSHAHILFERYGIDRPKRIHFVHSLAISLGLLARSDMLSIYPWPLIEIDIVRERLCALPIRDDFEETSIGIISRRGSPLSPAATYFVQCLREAVNVGARSSDPDRRRLFHSIDVVM